MVFFKKINRYIVLAASILLLILVAKLNYSMTNRLNLNQKLLLLQSHLVKDFLKYDCKSMTRFGSNSNSNQMYRIDGIYIYFLL